VKILIIRFSFNCEWILLIYFLLFFSFLNGYRQWDSIRSVLRIPDPNVFHPGSGSASKNLSILTQKIPSKLSKIWYGMFIRNPDPGSGSWFCSHPGSRIPVPDPDPQLCITVDYNIRVHIMSGLHITHWALLTCYLGSTVVSSSPKCRRVEDTSLWDCNGRPSRSDAPPLVSSTGPRTRVEQQLFRYHTRCNKNSSGFQTGLLITGVVIIGVLYVRLQHTHVFQACTLPTGPW
jgi:hypothetical protein